MKYLQKTTLCLAAIVVMALGNNVMAADVIDPTDTEVANNTVYAGTKIVILDGAANGQSAAILTGVNTIPIEVQVGKMKVGDAAAPGAKTTTGATTIESGAILEITAATENCIAGNVEVKSGGILQVDADIPASDGPFASGAGLTVHSGAILKLGAGKKWSKDLTIS